MESAQSMRSCCRRRGRRQGIALVNALIFAVLSMAFLLVAIHFVTLNLKEGSMNQRSEQVYGVAMGGLNAAVAWLRQQPQQPVTVFDPKSANDAPDLDSETPSEYEQIGLVKAFTVDPVRDVMGCYVVGRATTDGDPAPARGDVAAAGAQYATAGTVPWTAEDISHERGYNVAGSVWLVKSMGYLYDGRKYPSTTSLELPLTKPLQKLELQAEVYRRGFHFYSAAAYGFAKEDGTTTADAEPLDWFQRVARFWLPPAYAAAAPPPLFTLDHFGSSASNTVLKVAPGQAAYDYWTNYDNSCYNIASGTTVIPGTIGNAPGSSNAAASNFVSPSKSAQLNHIFGLNADLATDEQDLQSLADYVYNKDTDIPHPMPDKSFIYVNGDCHFDSGGGGKNPTLAGSGVLFITGKCTIDGNTKFQSYNGVIICLGDYTQQHGSTVTGAVITGGKFHLKGDDPDAKGIATLCYDSTVIQQVNSEVGIYELNRSTIKSPPSTASSTVY